ncbi:MAG: Holliday junction branch migration protein RuvA [Cryomorphaceae bacterium]|nr:Holliday junction branch migration protein RuvA [Flavobacteriales bacterium]
MIEYIKGELVARTPTHIVVETAGTGYIMAVSLSTFEALAGKKQVKILIHAVIREDAHNLYGFAAEAERAMFRNLISVSGIGPSSAMAALSTLAPGKLQSAIANGDVSSLQKIKGIGAKSAQRIIVDLKDKIGLGGDNLHFVNDSSNTVRSEALRALHNLGFDQRRTQKIVDEILDKSDGSIKIEDLIKLSLKGLA